VRGCLVLVFFCATGSAASSGVGPYAEQMADRYAAEYGVPAALPPGGNPSGIELESDGALEEGRHGNDATHARDG